MLFEKRTHFGKQNKPGVERTSFEVNTKQPVQMGRNAYWKHEWKIKLTIEKKTFTHMHLTSVRQYYFLTGHSLWNWSKAQQCQSHWSTKRQHDPLLFWLLHIHFVLDETTEETTQEISNPFDWTNGKKCRKGSHFCFDVFKAIKICGELKKLISRLNGNDVIMQNLYLHLLSLLLSCPAMCAQSGGSRSWSRNCSRTCGRTSSFCGQTMEKYNLYLDSFINSYFIYFKKE